MRFQFRFLAALCACAVAACAGGCAYAGKKQNSPSARELWGPPANVASDLTPQPAAPESKLPSEPFTLASALDTALGNNPNTRASWFAAKAATAAKGKAYGDFYPQLSGSTSLTRSRDEFILNGNVPGFTGSTRLVSQDTVTSPGFSLTYTLFDFGARFASVRAAEANLIAANFQFNRALQETVFEVQRRYFLLHAAQALVRANEESIRDASRNLEAANRSFQIGSKPKQDALQAEATLRRAEFNLESSKAGVEDARAQFAAVLGVRVTAEIAIQPPDYNALSGKRTERPVSELVEQALRQRPDLLASYAEARSRDAGTDLALRQSLPRLVGTASGHRDYIYGESGAENDYSIGAELQIPLFTGFHNYYAVKEARAEAAQAHEESRAKELAITSEVWSAFFSFQASERQVHSANALIAATQESYRALEHGYANGSNSVLDLLAAQQDVANARQSLISAQSNWAISLAALELASGELPDISGTLANSVNK